MKKMLFNKKMTFILLPSVIFAMGLPALWQSINSSVSISEFSRQPALAGQVVRIAGNSRESSNVIDSGHKQVSDPLQQAQISVKNRYLHRDISSLAKSYSDIEAFDLFSQIWQLINYYYYNETTPGQLFSTAMLELKVAACEPEIRSKYDISEQQANLIVGYISDRGLYSFNSSKMDYYTAKSELESISELCRKNNMNSSWPVFETIFALCNNLDIYSDYIMPEKYQAMLDSFKGDYQGVGTDLIFRDNDYPLVFDVLPGSPAGEKGILPGDKLIQLNTWDMKSANDMFFDSIFYESDKKISFKVERGVEILDFSLEKSYLHSSTIRNVHIIPGTSTKYIRITSFDKQTPSELSSVLNDESEQIDSVIIDLRNNGGGIVTSAIETADLFLDSGKIVSIKSFAETKAYHACADNIFSEEIPVFILVNSQTASAAEIFTAALKQNRRAITIGEKTFGKAMVQTVYDLRHKAGAVILTTAQYLPPSSQSFNLKGITPDIEVIYTENGENNNSERSITERISTSDPVMKTVLKCVTSSSVN